MFFTKSIPGALVFLFDGFHERRVVILPRRTILHDNNV